MARCQIVAAGKRFLTRVPILACPGGVVNTHYFDACYFPIAVKDDPRLHMKFKPQHQWRVLEMRTSRESLIAVFSLDQFAGEILRLPCGRQTMFV